MDDSLDPAAREALIDALRQKAGRLLAEHAELSEQRAALLARQRQNARDLADCRATARLFELEIEIPNPDQDATRERDSLVEEMTRMQSRLRRLADDARPQPPPPRVGFMYSQPKQSEPTMLTLDLTAAAPAPPPAKRPTLKDFILERLRLAGGEGAKAANLREMFERASGETIHEKTVGMTLYRMSKDRLVTRDGHTWFIADTPKGAEVVNPGGETPGSDDLIG